MAIRIFQIIPLAAVFIDWEHFFSRPPKAKIRSKLGSFNRSQKMALGLCLGLTVVQWAIAASHLFRPAIDKEIGLFPFTSFPMYSDIRAPQPYSEHQNYMGVTVEFETSGSKCSKAEIDNSKKLLDSHFYWLLGISDVADVRERAGQVREFVRSRAEFGCVEGAKLIRRLSMVPAYPAKVEVVDVARGLIFNSVFDRESPDLLDFKFERMSDAESRLIVAGKRVLGCALTHGSDSAVKLEVQNSHECLVPTDVAMQRPFYLIVEVEEADGTSATYLTYYFSI